jgi:hypothetical protein
MKLSTEDTGLDIPLMPTGLNQAVLTQFIDYGTQTSEFEGEEKIKRECRVGFTFPDVLFEFDAEKGEEPRTKSVFCTLSGHPKAKLNLILTSLTSKSLPEEFDPKDYLGLNALINITHEKNKKDVLVDKLVSFAPLMKGFEVVVGLPTRYLDLDEFDKDIFLSLGEKEQVIIKKSPEFQALSMPF